MIRESKENANWADLESTPTKNGDYPIYWGFTSRTNGKDMNKWDTRYNTEEYVFGKRPNR